MTAEQPQPWYERLIPASLRGIFTQSNESATLTQEQQEAEEFDDGFLYDDDEMDERQIDIFQPPLHWSEQRGEWVARFISPPGKPSIVPYVEWTHSELLAATKVLPMLKMKPSQTTRALAAFSARIDREVSKLQYDD